MVNTVTIQWIPLNVDTRVKCVLSILSGCPDYLQYLCKNNFVNNHHLVYSRAWDNTCKHCSKVWCLRERLVPFREDSCAEQNPLPPLRNTPGTGELFSTAKCIVSKLIKEERGTMTAKDARAGKEGKCWKMQEIRQWLWWRRCKAVARIVGRGFHHQSCSLARVKL